MVLLRDMTERSALISQAFRFECVTLVWITIAAAVATWSGDEGSGTRRRLVKTDKSNLRPRSRPRAAPITPRAHGILNRFDRGRRSTRSSSGNSNRQDRWFGRNRLPAI